MDPPPGVIVADSIAGATCCWSVVVEEPSADRTEDGVAVATEHGVAAEHPPDAGSMSCDIPPIDPDWTD
jgi:hypothetical protein